MWINDSSSKGGVQHAGCWQQNANCEDSLCLGEKTHNGKGFFFCCCNENLCNGNFSLRPETTRSTVTSEPSKLRIEDFTIQILNVT